MFRSKEMTAGEAAQFEEHFDLIWSTALKSEKGTALFRENGSLAGPAVLLIASTQPDLFERSSLGGWADCADATDRAWILLRGHASANEDFGLPRPKF